MKKYNQPEFKVTECSVNEDILTTSSFTDLHDITDYEFGTGTGLFGI